MKKSFSLQVSKLIKPYDKIIQVDSDKSISIRSFIFGAISHNISEVKNVLESDDVFSCINCLRKLGVKIEKVTAKHYRVFGKGLGSLYIKKNSILDCGNSGTTARLLIGLLSTNPGIQVKIKGDHSLNKRGMGKLINLMSEFGTIFLPKNKKNFPLEQNFERFEGRFTGVGVASWQSRTRSASCSACDAEGFVRLRLCLPIVRTA